jgi:hypothetical protein
MSARGQPGHFASKAGVKLLVLASPHDFFKIKDTIIQDTPIYIDSSLRNGIKGEEFARGIYNSGFHSLYLATASPEDIFPTMPWIKEIRGKSAPW